MYYPTSRSLLLLFGFAALVGCDPNEDPGESPNLGLELLEASGRVDPSFPEVPVEITFSLQVDGVIADEQVTFTAGAVELRSADASVSDGLTAAFLVAGFPDDSFDTDELSPQQSIDGVLSEISVADAIPLCTEAFSMVTLDLTMHASDCDCDVVVSAPAELHCFLDNRADALLAEPRMPAADRPCGATFEDNFGGRARFAYGYDASGATLIEDRLIEGMTTDRSLVRRDRAGTVVERIEIDAEERLVFLRVAQRYDRDGLLAGFDIENDGDGVTDATQAWTWNGSKWTAVRTNSDGTISSIEIAIDPRAQTLTKTSDEAVETITYAQPILDPNDAVATHPNDWLASFRPTSSISTSGEVFTWTYDGERIASLTIAVRDTTLATMAYEYDCP